MRYGLSCDNRISSFVNAQAQGLRISRVPPASRIHQPLGEKPFRHSLTRGGEKLVLRVNGMPRKFIWRKQVHDGLIIIWTGTPYVCLPLSLSIFSLRVVSLILGRINSLVRPSRAVRKERVVGRREHSFQSSSVCSISRLSDILTLWNKNDRCSILYLGTGEAGRGLSSNSLQRQFNLLFQQLEKITLNLIFSTLKLIFPRVLEKVSRSGVVINPSNFLYSTCNIFLPLTSVLLIPKCRI